MEKDTSFSFSMKKKGEENNAINYYIHCDNTIIILIFVIIIVLSFVALVFQFVYLVEINEKERCGK